MIRLLAIVAAMTALVACSSSGTKASPKSGDSSTAPTGSANPPFQINGKVVLANGQMITDNGPGTTCWAYGNAPEFGHSTSFDDVKEGAQVVVTDSSGKTLGLGTLGAGVADGVGPSDETCVFKFAVSDVPSGSTFYGIAVAGQKVKQFTPSEATNPEVDLG